MKSLCIPLVVILAVFSSTRSPALPLQTTVVGAESWQRYGWSTAVGDFNGDGRSDIVLLASNFPIECFTIAWGQPAGFPSTVDLASAPASTITLPVGYAGLDDFAVGDFNDDGFDDLLLWMYESNYVFRSRAYVMFGTVSMPAESMFLDGSIYTTTLTFPIFDDCALGIASGDINGDGVDDIAISVPCESASGVVHVLYGRESFPPTISLPDGTAAMILETQLDWSTGSTLAVGDVDEDGKSDVLFGSYQSDEPFYTRVTLVWGASLASGDTLSLYKHQSNVVRFRASENVVDFGSQVALGDINGDSFVDVVISAAPNDADGAAYIVHGGVEWDDIVFVDNGSVPATKIFEQGTSYEYGFRLECAEVTGDVYDDVILGASYNVGKVAIVSGSASLPPEIPIASLDPSWFLSTTQPGDWFGLEVEVADVNRDAIDDILVGAHFHDSLGRDSNGAVFVFGGVNVTGIGDSPTSPMDFGSVMSFPNPFTTSTTIITDGASEFVDVYDVAGRKISSVKMTRASGRLTGTWDGTDSSGRKVASGVYFARPRSDASKVGRMLLVR